MKVFLAGNFPTMAGRVSACAAAYRAYVDGVKIYLCEAGGVADGYAKNVEDEEMKIYLAAAERCAKDVQKIGGDWNIYEGTNILQSFYYCNRFTEETIIPACKNFLLDSGAYTFFTSGKTCDWHQYTAKYADFINRNNIDLFFELDIDSLIGYETVKNLRHELEEATGKKAIPVWHKSRGRDEFERMCKKYDYVAIGGIASKEITPAEYKYFPWFISTAHANGAKIHGLGFTALSLLPKYHFDSVDSTSWVSGNQYGAVYKFNGRTMEKVSKPPGKRVKTYIVAVNNFLEWAKFAEYAEKNF